MCLDWVLGSTGYGLRGRQSWRHIVKRGREKCDDKGLCGEAYYGYSESFVKLCLKDKNQAKAGTIWLKEGAACMRC